MARTFIIPDAHGNWRLVLGLLEQEGITNGAGKRIVESEVQVIQLGDLANCVQSSRDDDLRALELVGPVIDVMLVGNHELPHFSKNPEGEFSGFWPYHEITEALERIGNYGFVHAAYAVDGILLTHAGVAEPYQHSVDRRNAETAARRLNKLFRERPTAALFNDVGWSRGGMAPTGGILWSDWGEPKSKVFPQIVGHTVSNTWRAHIIDPEHHKQKDVPTFQLLLTSNFLGVPGDDLTATASALCLDIGAGKHSSSILGAWIESGVVRLVSYSTI